MASKRSHIKAEGARASQAAGAEGTKKGEWENIAFHYCNKLMDKGPVTLMISEVSVHGQ